MMGLLTVLIIILLDTSLGSDYYYLEGFKKINITELKEKSKKNNDTTSVKEQKAIEGSSFLDLQHTLRTGKSSNSIAVSPNLLEPVDDVLPNEPDDHGFQTIQGNM